VFATTSQTVPELFAERLKRSAASECYRVKRDGQWVSTTWGAFHSRVDTVAAGLLELGIERGDAVAILGGTQPEWCAADLGIIALGGTTVGIYPTLMADQIAFMMSDSGCRILFVEAPYAANCMGLLEAVESLERVVVWGGEQAGALSFDALCEQGQAKLLLSPNCIRERESTLAIEDVAVVVYTSGTTGQPKGVPLTHGNIMACLAGGEPLMQLIEPDDITMSFLPMAHVGEHIPGFFGRLNAGIPTAFATSYETLLDELVEVRPTYFGAVPRIFEKMYGRIHERVAQANPRRQMIFAWAKDLACRKARAETGGPPLSLKDRMMLPVADRLIYRKIRAVFGGRVKGFVTGSAPVHIDILEFFYGIGMKIIELYGLSEATAISFANTFDDIHLGTVGRALPGLEYRFAEDGELLLKGPMIFGGYLNLPEEDAKTFTEDGYLRTGDIGEVDEHGCLRITDRKKNLIKTAGGKYVVPARIEQLVKSEPLISQVYIHGDMRPYVVALVTLDERETPRVAEELGCAELELSENAEVQRRISEAFDRANSQLARFEQIKYHQVLPADFSIEEGTLTPTMKLKRRHIAQLYSDRIDGMYQAASL
jgi:long-chain acyl-CoA synthetase